MTTKLKGIPALLLLFTLTHCASTRPTPTDPVPAVTEAPAPSPEAATEPAAVPEPGASRPNDWYLGPADGAFPGIGVDRAYETLLSNKKPKQTVVVAVIDSGVDIAHEDLQGRIWVNDDEVPGNGEDDDHNGYVDDVYGWNFIGGPDGRQVQYDTYELTRLYARLGARFDGKALADVPEGEQADYETYLQIKAAYEEKVQNARQQYDNVSGFAQAAEQATAFAKEKLGREDVTAADLDAFDEQDPTEGQVRRILAFMVANNITMKDLRDYLKQLEKDLEYRYNLEFDPRPIVGDHYEDPTERYYGNADVAGPDPEHGTHVAGIIAANRDNGVGAEGVADAARIMVIRTVPDGDERDKDVANAIRYAVDNGAKVVNMSFGKAYSPYKAVVDEAVRYAEAHGVLLVHGAGNDAEDLDDAANFPSRVYSDGKEAQNWIEVGATSFETGADFVAGFSNYGKHAVDLFAPGVAIYSTLPGQEYGERQGTSMASPVVAGVAALVMAYYPDLTAVQVRDLLMETTHSYAGQQVHRPGDADALVDFGELSRSGGVIDAYAALKRAAALAR